MEQTGLQQTRLLAKVAVDKAVFHFDRPFDYVVPEQLTPTLRRGCRVLVPFGSGNRKRQGMVLSVYPEPVPTGENAVRPLKALLMQIDAEPIFNEEMFRMADFMVDHTFCTYYDAVKTILPNAYDMNVSQSFELTRCPDTEELDTYPFSERELLRFLEQTRTRQELELFLEERGADFRRAFAALLQSGLIREEDSVRQKVSDKTVRMVRLSVVFREEPERFKLTPKQTEITEFLSSVEVASKKEVLYFCAVGEGVLKKLVERGVAEYFEREIFRTPQSASAEAESLDDLTLSEQQQGVYEGLCELLNQDTPQAALLYGITGSGKTSVFIKLIERTVQEGRQALMLVPEISLTPQIVQKFKSLFGEQIAVMHSNLSLGERLDEYKRMKRGKARIVVGTRSAVFVPFDNIGLIIMDEEGESSYKSDSAPRYHARELAKLRVLQHNALLLLASATPSVESYYKAKQGTYHLFQLQERYANAVLPEVYLVDMKDEERHANTTLVSRMLQQEIVRNLERQEQTILFINRRGYNTVASCMECGEVLKCPHCDVALTYHKDNGYLMCHYCGHSRRFERICPSCQSPHLRLSGQGTQKIEDELQTLFPQARVLRMDTDSTYSRFAYAEKFESFRQGEYDILIGTQMIAKGLDFPNVTLVGVLNIDSGLYSMDYRGVERVFSLITQVVGRSGRAEKNGRAYIQTFVPDNPVINFAAQQDFDAFYADEIVSRKALLYPPFCDLCVVGFSGVREKDVEQAACAFLQLMQDAALQSDAKLACKVLGPVKPSIYRMNGKYRQRVLIKCRDNAAFRRYLRGCLIQAGRERQFRGITVTVDVNGDVM